MFRLNRGIDELSKNLCSLFNFIPFIYTSINIYQEVVANIFVVSTLI